MAHMYKVDEWRSSTGRWHCNDTKDLAGVSGKWWVPARILEMSLTDYILLLKEKFNADIESYYEPTDTLLFSWKNYSDCHRYVLFINNIARKANAIV